VTVNLSCVMCMALVDFIVNLISGSPKVEEHGKHGKPKMKTFMLST
jgi:hypothetical protein